MVKKQTRPISDFEAYIRIHLVFNSLLQCPSRRWAANLSQRPGDVVAHQGIRFAGQRLYQVGYGSRVSGVAERYSYIAQITTAFGSFDRAASEAEVKRLGG